MIEHKVSGIKKKKSGKILVIYTTQVAEGILWKIRQIDSVRPSHEMQIHDIPSLL